MTAQSAGHEPMSTSGWQLTPRCYNTSYRVAAFRALIIALILAAGLAFLSWSNCRPALRPFRTHSVTKSGMPASLRRVAQ